MKNKAEVRNRLLRTEVSKILVHQSICFVIESIPNQAIVIIYENSVVSFLVFLLPS